MSASVVLRVPSSGGPSGPPEASRSMRVPSSALDFYVTFGRPASPDELRQFVAGAA